MSPTRELALTAKHLPRFDAGDYYETAVAADRLRSYEALRRLDFSRSRLVRTIFGLRTLPSLLRGEDWGAPAGPFLEQALAMGWVILEEQPGSELAAGAVTQPWEPVVTFHGLPPQEFAAFSEPGFVKIVWGFAARPATPGSIVATETRVLATDEASRKRFQRYWFVFGLGIRLIRRLAFRVVRRDLATLGRAS